MVRNILAKMESTTQPLQSNILTVKKPLRLNKLQSRTWHWLRFLPAMRNIQQQTKTMEAFKFLACQDPMVITYMSGSLLYRLRKQVAFPIPPYDQCFSERTGQRAAPLTVTLTSDGIGYDKGLGRFLKDLTIKSTPGR